MGQLQNEKFSFKCHTVDVWRVSKYEMTTPLLGVITLVGDNLHIDFIGRCQVNYHKSLP